MPDANPALLDYLASRRSLPAKLFTAPAPDKAALEAILTLALRVPDHGKLEPWRLVVIDKAAMARLADLAEARAVELGADAEKTAKARGQYDLGHLAVAVISSPKSTAKIPLAEQILSAGALCMNIIHAANASGWGACWLSGWPSHDSEFAARAFGCGPVEGGIETIAGIIHIATPPAQGPADRPRPDLSRVVSWA